MNKSVILSLLALVAATNVSADTTLPTVSIGSKGQSYYCPSSYQGMPFTYADIANYHGAQQSVNGCYIPDKKSSCDITCHYDQPEIAAPTVSIGSKGQSYYCPSSYQGKWYTRAVIANYHNAQQSSNGCYIQDKKASCDITCYYR